MTLDDVTRTMLGAALDVYRDSPRATGWLHRHLARFDEPLQLVVVGPAGSGKSTVVNALAGDEIAPVEIGGEQALTYYRDGQAPRALAHPASGPPWELAASRVGRRLDIEPTGLTSAQVERVAVDWPGRALRDLGLIDTPGIHDDTPPHTVEGICMDADAVLYLVRSANSAELRFLRSVHDHPIARATPVSSLVLLTRADELGAGRVDALISARQIARRFRREPQVRELCQDVHAVAGLVAATGRTLRDAEFSALSALASISRADLEPHLMSVDRFVNSPLVLPVPPADLLARLGLFGIRLAITLVRRGSTPQSLAADLVKRSGLDELRDSIGQNFVERRHVLKARSALIALEVVLRMEPRPAAAVMAADLERALAGAHDFAELRLLSALRTGRIELPADELGEEAVRLVGGAGCELGARLGTAHEPSPGQVARLAHDAVRRWRELAADPALTSGQRWAAGVVVHSCEVLIAEPAFTP